MDVLPPLQELLPLAAELAIAGIIAGFLAGLFGIGGGAVLVPVSYQILGTLGVDDAIRMHISVGTSLAIIVPTALRSTLSHFRRGAVDTDLLRSFLVPVPAGVIAASIVAAHISGSSLRLIFAAVAFVVAVKLLFSRDNWKLGTNIPHNPLRAVCGFAIGFLSTLMGIGGGVFNNTFMTLYGRQILQAVATSAGVGVLISIPGVLGYVWAGWGEHRLPPYSAGFVNIPIALIIIPLTLLLAPLGVRAAHALPKRLLEIGFGVFLLTVSLRFFVSLL
jgi:uncharacterized protein